MNPALIVTAAVAVQRLVELRYASRNYHRAMARGGVEHGAGHYWMFVVLHAGWLAGMNVEWWYHTPPQTAWSVVLLAEAALLQGGRYWIIRSLGPAWNTRIVTWPGMELVAKGPFRWLRHPNYVVVTVELVVVPLALGCWWTAAIATFVNAAILLGIRIPAEEAALRGVASSMAKDGAAD